MQPARTPLWQQATALVSVTASGAITGLSYVPGPASELASPASLPVQLLALQQSASAAPAGDAMLRGAIVNVARHYLRMAADSTPAETEAMIWRRASLDGADHGASCAAFASLTLELGARAAGRSSWVTGGHSYPWPLHSWADVRVDENPASPAIVSVLQDAEAHDRWHPLGDGYRPLPGDWVLFDGHVEVVTGHSRGLLQTIGGDSLPDFSVNAHEYAGSLAEHGIQGFVDNGRLPGAGPSASGGPTRPSARPAPQPAGGGQQAGGHDAGTTGGMRSARNGGGDSGGSGGTSTVPHRHGQHHHGLGAPGRQGQGRQAGAAAIPGIWSGMAAAASAAKPAHGHPRSAAAESPPWAASPAGTASIPGTGTPQAGAAGAAGPAAPAGDDGSAQQAAPQRQPGGGSHTPPQSPAHAGKSRAGQAQADRAQADQAQAGSAPYAAVPGLATPGAAGAAGLQMQQRTSDHRHGHSPAGSLAGAAVPGLVAPNAAVAASGAGHRPAGLRQPDQSPAAPAADAAVPGLTNPGALSAASAAQAGTAQPHGRSDAAARQLAPGGPPADTAPAPGTADIPGLPAGRQSAGHAGRPGNGGRQPSQLAGQHSQHAEAGQHGQGGQHGQPGQHSPSTAPAPSLESPAEQAFISEVAPGAVAAQRRYGVPASVTIAQAIMESGWGQSVLAARDHNLFGIKGSGPAGTDLLPTREFQSGHWVTIDAGFRVYHNDAESIDDHGRLLATSGFYTRAMQQRRDPDAFADALTGVYATDPDYGAQLITLMRRYDLQRFDLASASGRRPPATQPVKPGRPSVAKTPRPSPGPDQSSSAPGPAPAPAPATQAPSPSPSPSPSTASTTAAFSEPAPAVAAAPAARPAPRAAFSGQVPAAAAAPSTPSAPAGPGGPVGRAGESGRAMQTAGPAPATPPKMPSPSASQPGRGTPAARAGRTRRLALYRQPAPLSVRNAFVTSAKVPLIRAEPLYRDVAGDHGIAWQLLAACDWMQCKARLSYSPVHGEKLGTANPDGSSYRTKSAALAQCAEDLACLARAVYGIKLTAGGALSVRELAEVFAAFRWGGLLRVHSTSAMEFPYSVAGLTALHLGMRWPAIPAVSAPDKPGSRFRMPFGAVPVVLRLGYPATT